jgi:NAD(P)-dependent dehydrogenase (short-subunit alcohol dehydrogenase family)
VVVNDAGYSVAGLAETATSQQMLDELNTNGVGMQRLNRAVLPGMRAPKWPVDPRIEHPRPDSHSVPVFTRSPNGPQRRSPRPLWL